MNHKTWTGAAISSAPILFMAAFTLLQINFEYPDILRQPAATVMNKFVAGGSGLVANELAAKGLNVNAIAPGYMATDNTAPLRADAERSTSILDRIPAGRWGEPADLMGAVVFLASAASDYLNGAIVPVDGGWLTR